MGTTQIKVSLIDASFINNEAYFFQKTYAEPVTQYKFLRKPFFQKKPEIN